ncbi:hypothetical protein R50073_45810 [Maricurvus nonylphenolicus]|uniref:hypothetical protein n=1 Tax=Maricurvus nonylphenolicus TaxID=1008307 RepID=UPI0036F38470
MEDLSVSYLSSLRTHLFFLGIPGCFLYGLGIEYGYPLAIAVWFVLSLIALGIEAISPYSHAKSLKGKLVYYALGCMSAVVINFSAHFWISVQSLGVAVLLVMILSVYHHKVIWPTYEGV